jgi:TPR repeat protein
MFAAMSLAAALTFAQDAPSAAPVTQTVTQEGGSDWAVPPLPPGFTLDDPSAALRFGNDALVRSSYAEALYWYRAAADQGDASAQDKLGFLYGSGLGVPQNYVEAARWYRLAADQGDAGAQGLLGWMYHRG